MASSTKTNTRESKEVSGLKGLLQTNNVFLYIPNIIGMIERRILHRQIWLFRLCTCFSFDCVVLFHADTSEYNDYLLFNK